LEAVREFGADAVAMVSRGRGASRLLVASVADKVLRDGPATMLLLSSHVD
jgi:nucleotide-binding universal stress UspA family protein